MSNILELDSSGRLVSVDPRQDVAADLGFTSVTSSQIPMAAKNLDVTDFRVPDITATVGGGANQAVKTLQSAINQLGGFIKNKSLLLVVDGLMGRKTQAATNKAITIIKAPVSLPLSMIGIKTEAIRFAKLVNGWIAGRKALATKTVAASKPFRASRKNTTKQLQGALRDLAAFVNNNALSVGVDGIAGPKTQAATNLAFSKYVKTNQVKTLPISPRQVEDLASKFASEITTYITNAKIRTQEKAITTQKAVDAAKQVAPAKAPLYDKAQATALQRALTRLGSAIPNPALNVAVDGLIGPKTQAATNLALSRYVSGISADMKTGKLTQAQISKGAAALSALIDGEAVRRMEARLKPKPPSPVKESQVSAISAQKKVDAAKKANPPAAPVIDRSLAIALQKGLNALYVAVNEPTWSEMKVKVDGIIGPRTRSSVNFALKRIIKAATAQMKGGYTIHQIGKASAALTKLIWDEIALRQQDTNKREADRIEAQKRMQTDEIAKVKAMAIRAAKGDKSAQAEMQKLAIAATTSKDAKTQQKARDMLAIAIAAVKTIKVELPKRRILSYKDERKINMPLDMIEDEAEIGAMIGLGEHLGGEEFVRVRAHIRRLPNDADIGSHLALSEQLGDVGRWGFLKRLSRRASRLVRKGLRASPASLLRTAKRIARRGKRIGSRALKLAKRGLRVVKNIALLPLKLQLKMIKRFMLPLMKAYCKLPTEIQKLGAGLAGVPFKTMLAFCAALKIASKSGALKGKKLKAKRLVNKLTPVALKVAVRLAVKGQFPAAVPIIRALKLVPGISKLPGMSYLGGNLGDMGAFNALPKSMLITGAAMVPGAELLVLDPMAMFDELESDELTTMDGDLSDPEGWEYLREDSAHADAMGAYLDESGTMGEHYSDDDEMPGLISGCGDADCY